MSPVLETVLTAREASFVAGVEYDKVLKAFEHRQVVTVSHNPRKRTLDLRGVFRLAIAERLKGYPEPVKQRLQEEAAKTIGEARALTDVRDVDCAGPVMVTTLRTSELARLVAERLEMIKRLHDMIVTDDAVQAGAPVFAGTRIMVRHIAGLVRNGVRRQEIAEDFPELTDDMIALAVLYDELYPPRGRPMKRAGGHEVPLPD